MLVLGTGRDLDGQVLRRGGVARPQATDDANGYAFFATTLRALGAGAFFATAFFTTAFLAGAFFAAAALTGVFFAAAGLVAARVARAVKASMRASRRPNSADVATPNRLSWRETSC